MAGQLPELVRVLDQGILEAGGFGAGVMAIDDIDNAFDIFLRYIMFFQQPRSQLGAFLFVLQHEFRVARTRRDRTEHKVRIDGRPADVVQQHGRQHDFCLRMRVVLQQLMGNGHRIQRVGVIAPDRQKVLGVLPQRRQQRVLLEQIRSGASKPGRDIASLVVRCRF